MVKESKSEDDLRGLLCCLVAHDSSTGSVLAVPCKSKASARHLGVELMRFMQGLGHATFQIKCDSEPATLNLQKAIVTARQRLGLKTLEQNPPIHHHQSSGSVEKAPSTLCLHGRLCTSHGLGIVLQCEEALHRMNVALGMPTPEG